jgi:hypothetical protein
MEAFGITMLFVGLWFAGLFVGIGIGGQLERSRQTKYYTKRFKQKHKRVL